MRPNEYIREKKLETEIIEKLPNKNPIKMRKKITELYHEKQVQKIRGTVVAVGPINYNNNIVNIKNEELIISPPPEDIKKGVDKKIRNKSLTSKSVNFYILEDAKEEIAKEEYSQEFFKFFEMQFNMTVVDFEERDETEEEFHKRKFEIETKIKNENIKNSNAKKGVKTGPETVTINITPLKHKFFLPSDITMNETLPKYSKWVSSVFQIIKDLKLTDVNTNESIYSKIYPQVDGAPVYNPHGRYWVKLFHMGKYRKIEIDDTMPCGKYEEFLLPKCEKLEELWPALLTKALIKLYSYKYHIFNYIFEEIGDTSIIYALTGYIGEKITIDLKTLQERERRSSLHMHECSSIQIIKNILLNENYEKSRKFLLGFNPSTIPDEEPNQHHSHKLSSIKNSDEEMSPIRHHHVKKRNSILEIETFKKKIQKAFPRRASTFCNQNKQTLLDSIEGSNQEALFSIFSIEKLHKAGRIDENLKEILLQNIDVLPKISIKTNIHEEMNNDDVEEFNEPIQKNIKFHSSISFSPENPNIQNSLIPTPSVQSVSNLTNTPKKGNINNVNTHSSAQLETFPKEQYSDKIYSDFAYSIVEYFSNDDFNMKRLKPVDFSDLKKKIQDAKVSYKQLTLDQKKSYISSIKELKQKQREEKFSRIEELKKPGDKHYFIKIKNDCLFKETTSSSPTMQFTLAYTDEEIEMAKKCLLNHWSFPHPDFFTQTFNIKDLNISVLSDIKSSTKGAEITNSIWTRDFYKEEFLGSNLNNYEHFQEPLTRHKGVWLDFADFIPLFKSFIVLHNPTYYRYQMIIDNNSYINHNDIYQASPEHIVFYLSNSSESDSNDAHNNNNVCSSTQSFCSNNKINHTKSCLLFLFEPNTNLITNNTTTNGFNEMKYYLNFDLTDSSGHTILNGETFFLNKLFSSVQYDKMEFGKDYFLILKGSVVPFGYSLRILSDHSIENFSYDCYLKKFCSYQTHNFKINYPNIEINKFYLLGRFKLNIESPDDEDDANYNKTKIIFNANKFHDNYFLQFVEIYIHQTSNNKKRRVFFNHEFLLNQIADKQNEIIIIICAKPPFNTLENVMDLDIITNNINMKIELIESIEPFEISDNYVLNKHGLILKELVYIPMDTVVYASIEFLLKKNDKEILLDEKIRMKMAIYRKEKLLITRDYFNGKTGQNIILDNITSNNESEMFISSEGMLKKAANNNININLNSKKISTMGNKDSMQAVSTNNNIPFNIYVYLDLTESPHYLNNPKEYENNVTWVIRVFSSDSMAFVKSTLKEDTEQSLKENWELDEPGRFEKAKLARVKFLLQLKKDRGDSLSQEEQNILTGMRKRKLPLLQNINTNADIKNTQTVNNKLPNAKNAIKQPVQVIETLPTESNLDMNKPLPLPAHHQSTFLKNFLEYAYSARTITKQTPRQEYSNDVDPNVQEQNPAPFCRTEDEIYIIKNEIEKRANEAQEKIKIDSENKLKEKVDMKDSLNKNYVKTFSKRSNKREQLFSDLMTRRNQMKESHNTKIEMENNLLDIISNSASFDLQYAINLFREAEASKSLFISNTILMKVFELISQRKEEFIRGELKKLTAKDKAIVVKHLEDIKSNKWNVSDEVVKKLTEISY